MAKYRCHSRYSSSLAHRLSNRTLRTNLRRIFDLNITDLYFRFCQEIRSNPFSWSNAFRVAIAVRWLASGKKWRPTIDLTQWAHCFARDSLVGNSSIIRWISPFLTFSIRCRIACEEWCAWLYRWSGFVKYLLFLHLISSGSMSEKSVIPDSLELGNWISLSSRSRSSLINSIPWFVRTNRSWLFSFNRFPDANLRQRIRTKLSRRRSSAISFGVAGLLADTLDKIYESTSSAEEFPSITANFFIHIVINSWVYFQMRYLLIILSETRVNWMQTCC